MTLRNSWFLPLTCLVVSFLVHARTLAFGFYAVDIELLPVLSSDASGLLLFDTVFRPASNAVVVVAKWVAGGRPFWYHAINLGLHLLNTALVYVVVRQVLKRADLAFVAAMCWTLLVWNAYQMLWVFDGLLIATLFSLAALTLFWQSLFRSSKAMTFAAVILYGLALLSKESAIPLVLILWLTAWLPGGLAPWKALRKTAPFWMIFLAYAIARTVFLGEQSMRTLLGGRLFTFGEGDAAVWLVGMSLNYLRQLFFLILPVPSMSLDIVGVLFVASTLGLGGSLGWFIWRCRAIGVQGQRALAYGAGWCLVGSLPFVTGSHPRVQYLVSIGLAVLVAAAVGIVLDGNRSKSWMRWVTVTTFCLYLLSNVLLSVRLQSFFSPDSPTILHVYASALLQQPKTKSEFETKLRGYMKIELERHGCREEGGTWTACQWLWKSKGAPIDLNDLLERWQLGLRVRQMLERLK